MFKFQLGLKAVFLEDEAIHRVLFVIFLAPDCSSLSGLVDLPNSFVFLGL